MSNILLFSSQFFLGASVLYSILFGVLLFFSGTGSYPPFEKGLQRNMRQTVRIVPLKAPKRSIALIP